MKFAGGSDGLPFALSPYPLARLRARSKASPHHLVMKGTGRYCVLRTVGGEWFGHWREVLVNELAVQRLLPVVL
jgi:hypothetical protein